MKITCFFTYFSNFKLRNVYDFFFKFQLMACFAFFSNLRVLRVFFFFLICVLSVSCSDVFSVLLTQEITVLSLVLDSNNFLPWLARY